MKSPYRELRTDTDLLTAALLQLRICVVSKQPGFDDYNGLIEAYTPFSVKVSGVRHMRDYHSFRVNV